ncbi:carbamate kinase [Dolosigranulum pigrum]|jgi:carbamate kinase|uniref:Carbamate kinase n=2 Tax=Dolosigranulum pigrum TaxID=29394 RepID=H3NC61_9LACT|nr:carbamate kinase [Dolosigranulum pigrum]EHR35294.1 carbamate kinase [Dolosigranulum pigrum ATCC 51524]OOL81925.1 carbamate kinase [Dolosigranulum pigrum]QDO90903.1 carbamate kinase [Dolosigranulum pigrum]QTJ32408.1 carbamate kinase [Dolosigranulum pigrum]QTJ37588.1 carbamate kinase [Dolosigranulum pigrum]
MSKRKIVVALGGNAILSDSPTAEAQKQALKDTAKQLVKLVKNGDELIITHGNGPQVGNLLLQNIAADSEKNPAFPLDSLVAMTEGSIGFWLQNAMQNELTKAGIDKSVATVVTQVLVDKEDPAFENPTKPIGPFYSEEEAKAEMEKSNDTFKEDAGRGWRKVVPSPKPKGIKEIEAIQTLIDNKQLVIAGGGGGIPVVEAADGTLEGVEAVIDKDFASQTLAGLIDADLFIVLTGVDNVYVNFNQPDQKKLENVTVAELEEYIQQDQFAPGSMLPKVQATMAFVSEKPGSKAVITSLENLENLIESDAGTIITAE